MANIDHAPSKYMLNLLHVLPAFADEEKLRINVLVENNTFSVNKYELITETGTLKLDRVGFSTLVYPFAYGAIPCTWDEDNDGGEVDDKVIGLLADDKRMDHITHYDQLGPHWLKETQYFWEHYKDLKKPGTCHVNGFFDATEAVKVIKECEVRYVQEYLPKFQ